MDKANRKDRIRNIIVFILFIIVTVYLLGRDYLNKELVLDNYSITEGHIVDFYMVGEFDTQYMVYEYTVDRITFSRKINPSKNLDSCYDNAEKCGKAKFLVIYSKVDPSKSLINLSVISQGLDNLRIQINTKEFE